MAWYYGWTYPWYLFSNNFGTLMWLGLGLLFLFSIPVVGPIMRKIAWWIWVNLFWRIIKFPFKRWKEGRKKKGLRARYRAIRGAYFAMLLRDAARNIIRNTPGFRNRYIKIKNIAGREPEIVFRNRILFMRLLDQELRFDIFYTKFLYMNEFHHKIIEKTSKTHGFLNQQDLKKLILVLRSQKGKIPFELINPDGTRVPIEVGEGGDQERIPPYLPYSKYKNFIGWNYLNQAIIMYMNHLIEFFKIQIELAKKIRKTGGDLESFYKELIGIAQSKITTDVAKIEGQIKVSKEQFDDRLKDYTPHYTIRAHTLNMWDMFNSSGKAYHTYRFAKRGAKHIYKDKDGRTLKTVTGEIEEGEVNDDHTQVNVYGEFAEDVRKGTWPIRKLRNPKEDTIPFPPGENMGEIAEYYVRDWSGFIRDFRSGLR
ncbi:hypothetical protein HYT92_00750, partial [Candidatus Pacearchaeota archaeon]|nr:hypothetical protein [Candidatus Pacearchaeota archaeon]